MKTLPGTLIKVTFCNKIIDLLVYELADRRKRSRAHDQRAISERTSHGLRHLSRTSTVLSNRTGHPFDPRVSEAYSSRREPDVSFINLEIPRMNSYSEDEEERLLSDLEMPSTHTSALHDVYSAPSFYSSWSRPMSPPFDDTPPEEAVQSPRLDRRSMTFSEFLTSMGSSHPPPPQRSTDLVRRPTLHRRDYDILPRQRNRSSRGARSGSGPTASGSQSEQADFRGEGGWSSAFTTRRPSTWRHSLEDSGSASRNHPSSSRHRSFHGTGPPAPSSRLRRGGVQPPELISPSTESSISAAASAHLQGIHPGSGDLLIWSGDERLTALPTPRSTSPETNEERRET